jgi:prolipoprotein diacylglyceryltransferase
MVYGIIRIALEFFREPDFGDPLLAGLSRGQWFSFGLVVVGAGIWWSRGKGVKELRG